MLIARAQPDASVAPLTMARVQPLLAALLLHAVLLGLLLFELDVLLRPGGRSMPAAAMTVMLVAAPGVAAPAPSTEPAPRPEPRPQPQPAAPSPPARAARAAQPTPPRAASAAQSAAAQPAAPAPSEADTELADFLGNLRGRWLEPRGTPARFHCRLRIRYQAGGLIEAVHVESDCGSPELVDSIERAVWKSQPLPLRAARAQAGELSLEFSPP